MQKPKPRETAPDPIADIARQAVNRPAAADPRKSSMLALGVLDMIERLATATSGAVLEVGAYVGGSIIAVSRGVGADAGRKIVTIERGGPHLEHPTMPTDDVLRDLAANLAAAGLTDRVTVLPMIAQDAYAALPAVLTGQPVGLLIVDADANIGFHLPALAPHLAPGCVLVLDDYCEPHKGPRMRGYLADAARSGAIEEFGVCGFGTWVGRLRHADRLLFRPLMQDVNFAWVGALPIGTPRGDTTGEPQRSPARLFEDGRELGPAHSAHESIRYSGTGRWSHWNDVVYLSASDNTDPTLNGRRYELEIADRRIRLT